MISADLLSTEYSEKFDKLRKKRQVIQKVWEQ